MEKKQVMSDQIYGDGGLDFIPIDVYESRYDYKPAPVISYAGEFDYTPGLGFRSKILVSLPVDDDKVEKKKQIDVRPAFVDRDRFPGLTRDTSRLPATIIESYFPCNNCGQKYKLCEDCDPSKEKVITTAAFKEPLEFTCTCGKEFYYTFYKFGGW